jgi:hypothetical protein
MYTRKWRDISLSAQLPILPKRMTAAISILHTWGQNLLLHPHIHCAIPAGGLSPDHRRWIRPRYPFFLPVKVLSRVFRGKFLAGLAAALADPQQFAKLIRRLHRHDWVVYAKPAFTCVEIGVKFGKRRES